MSDIRPFIKVHIGLMHHAKIEALSDAAFRLLVGQWCECALLLSDGAISKRRWEKAGPARARKELVEAELVVIRPDGSLYMHDYLQHQSSAAEVMESRARAHDARVKGGEYGAHVRYCVKQGRPRAGCSVCGGRTPTVPAVGPAIGPAMGPAVGQQSLTHSIEEEEEEEVEVEEELKIGRPAPQAAPPSAKAKAKKRTSAPAELELTMAMRAWAKTAGFTGNLKTETEQFLDHHRGKGTLQLDWNAAWRTWIRNTVKWGATAPVTAKPTSGGDW